MQLLPFLMIELENHRFFERNILESYLQEEFSLYGGTDLVKLHLILFVPILLINMLYYNKKYCVQSMIKHCIF